MIMGPSRMWPPMLDEAANAGRGHPGWGHEVANAGRMVMTNWFSVWEKIITISWLLLLTVKKSLKIFVLRQNHQTQIIMRMVTINWEICLWAKSKYSAEFCYDYSKLINHPCLFSTKRLVWLNFHWKICNWTKLKHSAGFCCNALKA